jgi:chemotaxis family two-component system response regulator Rcp1
MTSLPAGDFSAGWQPSARVRSAPATGRPRRLRPVEVLIVEDNPSDSDLLRAAFGAWQTEVRLSLVEDGEQAVNWLLRLGNFHNAVRPDLIILDLNLPRKDGMEVLGVIKKIPALQQIPVVVLTTSDRDEDVKAAYRMHANCYLTKTMDVFEFFTKIEVLEKFWMTVARLPSD